MIQPKEDCHKKFIFPTILVLSTSLAHGETQREDQGEKAQGNVTSKAKPQAKEDNQCPVSYTLEQYNEMINRGGYGDWRLHIVDIEGKTCTDSDYPLCLKVNMHSPFMHNGYMYELHWTISETTFSHGIYCTYTFYGFAKDPYQTILTAGRFHLKKYYNK